MSEGDTSIFGSPSWKKAEHGKFPSVMETSYEVPNHMGLQQQDSDNKVELGPSPSTTGMSMNLFNNTKTAPILDSYSESSYDYDMIEDGDICTYITPTPNMMRCPNCNVRRVTNP